MRAAADIDGQDREAASARAVVAVEAAPTTATATATAAMAVMAAEGERERQVHELETYRQLRHAGDIYTIVMSMAGTDARAGAVEAAGRAPRDG